MASKAKLYSTEKLEPYYGWATLGSLKIDGKIIYYLRIDGGTKIAVVSHQPDIRADCDDEPELCANCAPGWVVTILPDVETFQNLLQLDTAALRRDDRTEADNLYQHLAGGGTGYLYRTAKEAKVRGELELGETRHISARSNPKPRVETLPWNADGYLIIDTRDGHERYAKASRVYDDYHAEDPDDIYIDGGHSPCWYAEIFTIDPYTPWNIDQPNYIHFEYLGEDPHYMTEAEATAALAEHYFPELVARIAKAEKAAKRAAARV